MTWTTYGSPFGSLTLTGDENHLRRLYFPGRAPSLNEADRDPEAFTHASVLTPPARLGVAAI